jgi:group I intron endonuclease
VRSGLWKLLDMTTGCYILTNNVNGKRYVGQSCNIEKRMKDHARSPSDNIIHKAIRKYGFSAFSQVIWECDNDSTDELEEFLISDLGTLNPVGYNLSTGGFSLRGLQRTPEWKDAISRGNKGKVRSEEAKAKLSAINKGKSPPNKGKAGKPWTEERRARQAMTIAPKIKPKPVRMTNEQMSVHMKNLYANGKHPMCGKPKSEETREKIRASLLGNVPWNVGIPMDDAMKMRISTTKKQAYTEKLEASHA